jgi:hypothetical protein
MVPIAFDRDVEMTAAETGNDEAPQRTALAEETFRNALLRSHRTRDSVGELESAAAQFCRELRRQGLPAEQVLKDAKRVIRETIDGHNVPVAERAVLSCIQHYFRTD